MVIMLWLIGVYCMNVVHLYLFECGCMPSCSCAHFNVCAKLLISPVCGSEDVACALQSTTTCAPCPSQSTSTENQSIYLYLFPQALSADLSTDMAPYWLHFTFHFLNASSESSALN